MANATHALHLTGQSLWLDNITRGMLDDGTLGRYIRDFSVTGLTSNPTIYNAAVKNTSFYDDAIAAKVRQGTAGEHLFFELATGAYGAVVARRAFAPDEARWLDTAEPRTDSPKRPHGLGALPPAAPPGRSTTLWWDVKVTALSPAGYTAELFYP